MANSNEIKAYIEGDNSKPNSEIYRDVKAGGGFSFLAGILGTPYCFYRKCYAKGFTIFFQDILIFLLITLAVHIIAVHSFSSIDTLVRTYARSIADMDTHISIAISISVFITVFMNGYGFYPAYIRNIECAGRDAKGNIEKIKEYGGVDRVAAAISFLFITICILMLIATIIHF